MKVYYTIINKSAKYFSISQKGGKNQNMAMFGLQNEFLKNNTKANIT